MKSLNFRIITKFYSVVPGPARSDSGKARAHTARNVPGRDRTGSTAGRPKLSRAGLSSGLGLMARAEKARDWLGLSSGQELMDRH